MRRSFLVVIIALAPLAHGEHVTRADAVDVAALRLAISDLMTTFGNRYPKGQKLLDQLAEREKVKNAKGLALLKREALLANPLVSDPPILFVTRQQYSNNHGTEATMCQTGEINTRHFRGGGAMKVLELPSGRVTTILELPKGVARDPEVHFDGKKVLFSMRRNIEDDYHLYEINTDGSGLKQLTTGSRLTDIQPVYMPDGKIVFSSTREPKYIPCQRHLMANLYTCDGDGSNIRQIGHNTQFEGRASLMPDGRILYTRWEYVDKHFAPAYGLWTVNPDGTNHALYYGGYGWQPSAIVDARIIPGTQKFVAVFSAVHELAWGAMVVADRSRGLDGMEPIVKSWPADIGPWMKQWNVLGRIGNGYDSFRRVPIKYEDPFPLSEKYFLCSRSMSPGRGASLMGLFLVDVFGNEVCLHTENPGCFDPMPIVPRKRPPAVPSRVDLSEDSGTFYVQDVYTGEFMDRVPRGTVKSLRIVEAPPKRTFPPWNIGDWTPALSADSHHPVAVNWDHYNNKCVLGKVPVEADGSAHFTVPAGKFVYFQLLDENGMMIHSMRSGTMLQPGESASCVGCHENRLTTGKPEPSKSTLAMKRPPSEIEPWYGPPRNFSYTAEVQPVLDRHCAGCHDYGKEAEGLNLSGDKGIAFNASYSSLRSRSPAVWLPPEPGEQKPLISAVGAGPVKVIPPYSWGSHRSRLAEMLLAAMKDDAKSQADSPCPSMRKLRLDRESFDRIVTWIDLNTPYYPSHATYYAANTFGRCPLDHRQLTQLGKVLGAVGGNKTFRWGNATRYSGTGLSRLVMTGNTPCNFTRPEHSACLAVFRDDNDPKYREALAIIQSGREMLEKHPRLDMPGFEPCETDRARIARHNARRQTEAANRAAIARGEKIGGKQ